MGTSKKSVKKEDLIKKLEKNNKSDKPQTRKVIRYLIVDDKGQSPEVTYERSEYFIKYTGDKGSRITTDPVKTAKIAMKMAKNLSSRKYIVSKDGTKIKNNVKDITIHSRKVIEKEIAKL